MKALEKSNAGKGKRRKSFLIQLPCPEFILFAVHCGEKCRNLLLIQNEMCLIKQYYTIPEQRYILDKYMNIGLMIDSH